MRMNVFAQFIPIDNNPRNVTFDINYNSTIAIIAIPFME